MKVFLSENSIVAIKAGAFVYATPAKIEKYRFCPCDIEDAVKDYDNYYRFCYHNRVNTEEVLTIQELIWQVCVLASENQINILGTPTEILKAYTDWNRPMGSIMDEMIKKGLL